jgi:hypothetical protein
VIGPDSSTKSPRTTSPESKGIRRGSSPLPSCSPHHQQRARRAARRQTAHHTHRKSGRLSPSSWPSPVGVARPPKKGPKALWGRATPTGEGQDGGLRPRVLARAWRPSEANAGHQGQSRPSKPMEPSKPIEAIEANRGQSRPIEAIEAIEATDANKATDAHPDPPPKTSVQGETSPIDVAGVERIRAAIRVLAVRAAQCVKIR